jgi:hypothetical protein
MLLGEKKLCKRPFIIDLISECLGINFCGFQFALLDSEDQGAPKNQYGLFYIPGLITKLLL